MPTWTPNVDRYDFNFKKRIVMLACRGKSRKDICKIMNKSKPIIDAVLNKYCNNRYLNSNWLYDESFERKVIYLYKNTNQGCIKISKYLNVSYVSIMNILHRNNVEIREPNQYRTYTLDENYFEIIDTEHKAYWIGFLMADGCVSRGRVTRLSLNKRDINSLENFKLDVGSNASIEIGEHDMRIVNLYSCKMVNDLSKYGIVQNKTKSLKFPNNIDSKLIKHVIRGYFDGDGCITSSVNSRYLSASVQIAGTKHVVEKIQKEFISIGTTKGSLYKRKDRNVYILCIGGTTNLYKIYKYLYDNSTIKMERKYNKFKSYFSKRNQINKEHVAEIKLRKFGETPKSTSYNYLNLVKRYLTIYDVETDNTEPSLE